MHGYIYVEDEYKFKIDCRFCGANQIVSNQKECCDDCLGGTLIDERPTIACGNGFNKDHRSLLRLIGQAGDDDYG